MLWKFVFWIAVLFGGWDLISIATSLTGNPTQDIVVVIGVISTFLGFISMYGFAYKVVIGSRVLAIFTFFINLSVLIYGLYVIQFWQHFTDGFWQIVLSTVGLVFLFLFFIRSSGMHIDRKASGQIHNKPHKFVSAVKSVAVTRLAAACRLAGRYEKGSYGNYCDSK